ncbi:MAG: AAA family ATPase, partial [Deltaproteobacteria bacterium]|nr:AAA family ATPase [Deltaproteobacteria bacterium]
MLGRGELHLPQTESELAAVDSYIDNKVEEGSAFNYFRKVQFSYPLLTRSTTSASGEEAVWGETGDMGTNILVFSLDPEIQRSPCSDSSIESFHESQGHYPLSGSFTREQSGPLNDFLAGYHRVDESFYGCVAGSAVEDGLLRLSFKIKMSQDQIPEMRMALTTAGEVYDQIPDLNPDNIENRHVRDAYRLVQALAGDEEALSKALEAYKELKDKGFAPPEPDSFGLKEGLTLFAVGSFLGVLLTNLFRMTRIGAQIEAVGEDEKRKAERKRLQAMTLDQFMTEFGEDWVEKAAKGGFERVEGRDAEVKDMFDGWQQKGKTMISLLGPAGIGKSAIAEEVARHIYLRRVIMAREAELRNETQLGANDRLTKDQVEAAGLEWSLCPESLARVQYWELKIQKLVAGTKYRGELEERVDRFIELSEQNPALFVHVEELYDSAKSTDANESAASQVLKSLKPALARGGVRGSASLTNEDYDKLDRQDPQVTRRFQPLYVSLLSDATVHRIIEHSAQRQLRGGRFVDGTTAPSSASTPPSRWEEIKAHPVRSSWRAATYPIRHPINTLGFSLGTFWSATYPVRHPFLSVEAMWTGARNVWVSRPEMLGGSKAGIPKISRELLEHDFPPTLLSRVVVPEGESIFTADQLHYIQERAKMFPGSEPDRSKTLTQRLMGCIQGDLERGELDPKYYTVEADGSIHLSTDKELIDHLIATRVPDANILQHKYRIEELLLKAAKFRLTAEGLGVDPKAYEPLPDEPPHKTIARLLEIERVLQNLLSKYEEKGTGGRFSSGVSMEDIDAATEEVKDTYARKGMDAPPDVSKDLEFADDTLEPRRTSGSDGTGMDKDALVVKMKTAYGADIFDAEKLNLDPDSFGTTEEFLEAMKTGAAMKAGISGDTIDAVLTEFGEVNSVRSTEAERAALYVAVA